MVFLTDIFFFLNALKRNLQKIKKHETFPAYIVKWTSSDEASTQNKALFKCSDQNLDTYT